MSDDELISCDPAEMVKFDNKDMSLGRQCRPL
jgi:hypothetical protein